MIEYEFIALILTVAGGIVINNRQNAANHKELMEKEAKDKKDTNDKYRTLCDRVEANHDEIVELRSEMQVEFAKCHQHPCKSAHGGTDDA